MVRVEALLPAAGLGERMGANGSKVLLEVRGKPLLQYVVEAFDRSPNVDAIHIVAAQPHADSIRHAMFHQRWRKPIDVSIGGARRQDSVRLALQRLAPCDFVIVHDAARPLVHEELIAAALRAAVATGAATLGVPLTDSCKEVTGDGLVRATLRREFLRAVQTPQAFRYDWLVEAHRRGAADGVEVDDDAELVERLGHPVSIVPGDPRNLKITTPTDLLVMTALLERAP